MLFLFQQCWHRRIAEIVEYGLPPYTESFVSHVAAVILSNSSIHDTAPPHSCRDDYRHPPNSIVTTVISSSSCCPPPHPAPLSHHYCYYSTLISPCGGAGRDDDMTSSLLLVPSSNEVYRFCKTLLLLLYYRLLLLLLLLLLLCHPRTYCHPPLPPIRRKEGREMMFGIRFDCCITVDRRMTNSRRK